MQNEEELRELWDSNQSLKSKITIFMKSSSIYRLAKGVNNRLVLNQSNKKSKTNNLTPLVEKTVNKYFDESEITFSICNGLGIEAYFFWQPSIFQKTFLTDYEKSVFNKKIGLKVFYEDSGNLISKNNKKPIFIGNIFKDEKRPVWIDMLHCGPFGNQRISEIICFNLVQKSKIIRTQINKK